jgi:hypothetical protein
MTIYGALFRGKNSDECIYLTSQWGGGNHLFWGHMFIIIFGHMHHHIYIYIFGANCPIIYLKEPNTLLYFQAKCLPNIFRAICPIMSQTGSFPRVQGFFPQGFLYTKVLTHPDMHYTQYYGDKVRRLEGECWEAIRAPHTARLKSHDSSNYVRM